MKHILLAALLLGACATPALAQMSMSNPPAMPASTLAKSATGTNIYFVLRIDKINRTTAVGPVLDRVSGNTYRTSSSIISLHVPTDLPVIMGSRNDLKRGTVIYVYGVAMKPKRADATKVVVITPYVKMQ